ncbi:MAG TPA: CDP-glycerol glycerophosphotransferase family protein [Xanthomonadaceae bacterium]|nr:CDP-glycerol glycerophosphotransferase family protein [Xanthomonadaceae bacterium]
MKIDKKNPRHWLYLFVFGLNVLVAAVLRPLRARLARKVVVLYGHKLNGNLLPIYSAIHIQKEPDRDLDAVFLTLDPEYWRELKAAGERCVLATSFACIGLLSRADAVITSHGLHAMQPLIRLSDIRFFDVWHGIPYKGFDADDFRVQHRYDEIWVASELLRKIYIERYGFQPQRVHATGYPRTDRLVTRHEDAVALRRRFGAPDTGKLILFAPTWAQDSRGRSIYPFGHDEATFLGALSDLAARHDATILMRAHLNSGTAAGKGYTNVVPVPHGEFPDTEGILLISDLLICDWSSIAFDYLLLDRPTLFLDVDSPFRKGFSLGPEFRFGSIVKGLDQLVREIEQCLRLPTMYHDLHGESHTRIRAQVYGGFADGQATDRCIGRLTRCFAVKK